MKTVAAAIQSLPMSAGAFARRIGVSPAYVSHVVTGKRPPSAKVLTGLYLLGAVDAETAASLGSCPLVAAVESNAVDAETAWTLL